MVWSLLRRLPYLWPTASGRCSWAQCWWWMALPCDNAAFWGPRDMAHYTTRSSSSSSSSSYKRAKTSSSSVASISDDESADGDGDSLLHRMLPEDLLGAILSRLPPRCAAQARAVCTRWNRAVLSHPPAAATPWCMVTSSACAGAGAGVGCWALDPASGAWTRLPFPATPAASCLRLSRWSGSSSSSSSETGGGLGGGGVGVGMAGGLIGFTEHEWGTPLTHYWIGNPLTGTWRRIECRYDGDQDDQDDPGGGGGGHFYTVNELVVEPRTGGYRIVQLRVHEVVPSAPADGDEREDDDDDDDEPPAYAWTTHVYDSRDRRWRRGASTAHSRLFCMTSCVARGTVYFLLVADADALLTFEVLAYDVARDAFRLVMPPARVACPDGTNLSWATFQLFDAGTGGESSDAAGARRGATAAAELGVVAGVAPLAAAAAGPVPPAAAGTAAAAASTSSGLNQQQQQAAAPSPLSDLDEDFEWPLDKVCVLRFDRAAGCWAVDRGSQVSVDDALCRRATTGATGAAAADETGSSTATTTHYFFSRHKDVNTLLMYEGRDGAYAARCTPLPPPMDCASLLDTRGCWRAAIGTFLPRLHVKP